jgi:hypothetical protein
MERHLEEEEKRVKREKSKSAREFLIKQKEKLAQDFSLKNKERLEA